MKKKKSIARAEAVIVIAMILAILLPQLIGTTSETASQSERGTVSSVADFDGMTFAVVSGTVFEDYIREYFPSSECIYAADWTQMVMTVAQGKADAYIAEITTIDETLGTYDNLTVFPIPVCDMEESFAAAKTEKGAEAVELFNEYLAVITSDGTLDSIFDTWADEKTAPDHIDIPELTGERGTLTIGATLDWSPYCYAVGDNVCGSFIDLTYRFCAWAGYVPEFEYVDFLSILAGVSVGKYDFVPVGVTYTAERAEEMYFTDSLFGNGVYVVADKELFAINTTDAALTDYENTGVTVAVLTGADVDTAALKRFPDAEIMYFDTLAEVYTAVSSGKAELGMTYNDCLSSIMESIDNVAMLYEPLAEFGEAFAMQKNDEGAALRDEYNGFLSRAKADGRYDAIMAKWNSGDETIMQMGDYTYTGEKGALRIATTGTWYPKAYYIGDELAGEMIEFCCAFCAECGYTPEFYALPFISELTGVLSGDYDMIADAVPITPERREKLNFSETFLVSSIKLITRTETGGGEEVSKLSAFIDSMKSGFEKNFIREERWRMLLSGLKVTVALSVLAAIFGTLLGSGICALRMSKNDYCTGFARIFIKIIQGTPIVVLLLVLYYVVFGKVNASAFWVCVLGFSLDFAAYSAEIIRTGIESVPDGQRLAARALGFSRMKAFGKVVLPQAMVRIVPVFSGQFIAMVKMTSVAGYISVQDLTKASDIIRSRTYEAFFPLISTAIMYFLIAALLVSVLKLVEKSIDPTQRPRRLKGVNLRAD